MDRNEDLLLAVLEACAALDDASIPYALIGGVAVGIQSGQPRATVDVDLAVTTRVERSRVTEVLAAAGMRLIGEFEHTLNLEARRGEPVQVSFDAAFDPYIARAERVAVGDVSINVLSVIDLIATKEMAASDPARRRSKALRDRADIELLKGDIGDPNEGW